MKRKETIMCAVLRRLGPIALLATTLASAAMAAGANRIARTADSDSTTTLAIIAYLLPPEARARLATAGGVLRRLVQPGLLCAVYATAAPSRGSELAYGRAPTLPNPRLPSRPALPPDPTPLQRRAHEKALRLWRSNVRLIRTRWRRDSMALAKVWARRRAGGLAASRVRSVVPLSTVAAERTLYRVGLFFEYAPRRGRVLVVLADLARVRPPSPRPLVYDLQGATVVLAGWSVDDPEAFDASVAAWRGFFLAEGAARVRVLPRGLDPASEIAAAAR